MGKSNVVCWWGVSGKKANCFSLREGVNKTCLRLKNKEITIGAYYLEIQKKIAEKAVHRVESGCL